jgi:hypothetical protein
MADLHKLHSLVKMKFISESSLPLIIMQLHVLLLVACMKPLQQSSVGAISLPPTYGRQTCCNTWFTNLSITFFGA